MPIPIKTLSGCGLLAALAAMTSPVQAGPITVLGAGEGMRAETLRIADLNLASDAGRARLNDRINMAVRKVCDLGHNSALDRTSGATHCVTRARSEAWAQVEARVAAENRGAAIVGGR